MYRDLRLFFRTAEVVALEFLLESFDAAGRINKLLFTRVKRVTFRADVHTKFFNGGTRLECYFTRTSYCAINVVWMDILFHSEALLFSMLLGIVEGLLGSGALYLPRTTKQVPTPTTSQLPANTPIITPESTRINVNWSHMRLHFAAD